MKTYKLIKDDRGSANAVLCSDGWKIPFDPANTDYQAYLRWCEEGNEPLPASESVDEVKND